MEYYDLKNKLFCKEHRNWKIRLLLFFNQCKLFPIHGFIYQCIAGYLTRWMRSADISFHSQNKNPEKEIRRFCVEHNISLADWKWNKQIQEYTCLNEFFMRKYEHLDIGAMDVVSPASAVFTRLNHMPYNIKGTQYTLQNCGVPSIDDYINNNMYYLYLSPSDYHCFHSPIQGVVKNIVDYSKINTYSGSVKPDVVSVHPSTLTFNRRYVIIIENEHLKVAMVIIGGFIVDSIRIDPKIKESYKLEKGEYIGAFALGGSAILMLTTVPLQIPCQNVPIKFEVGQSACNL